MKNYTLIRGEDFFLGKPRPEQRALEPKSLLPSSLVKGGRWHGRSHYHGSRKHNGPVKQYSAEQIAQLNFMRGTRMEIPEGQQEPIANAIADAQLKMHEYKRLAAQADAEYSRWVDVHAALIEAAKLLGETRTIIKQNRADGKETAASRVARNRALIADAVRQLHGQSKPVTEEAVRDLLVDAGLTTKGAVLAARAAAKRGELK